MNDLSHHAPGPQATASREVQRRLELRADCTRCFALCCVAPAFSASADFAIDKAAGQPCPNLGADFRCSIHDRLRPRGFRGCAAFDCLGAGQKVAQVTFGGRDWRADPKLAAPMFAAFAVMRQLHELLWYLNEALALALGPADSLRAELDEALAATERMTNSGSDELVKLDVDAHRQRANAVLLRVSEYVRERGRGVHRGPDLRGADLTGKDLKGTDMTGACLRGALLIGADLRDVDLSYADLTGTDVRGADLSGANLETSLFTSQPQLDSAKGNSTTKLPPRLSRPSHWATAG